MDASQRRQLTVAFQSDPPPVAVLSSSRLVRAAGAALSAFNHRVKFLELHEEDGAFEFLGLSSDERDRARTIRRELEREIAPRSAQTTRL